MTSKKQDTPSESGAPVDADSPAFTFRGRTPEETEGVKQILSSLRPLYGGWHESGYLKTVKGTIDGNGVRTVGYNFDILPHQDPDGVYLTYPETGRKLVAPSLRQEISSIANLKFRELPLEEFAQADLHYFTRPMSDRGGEANQFGEITIAQHRTESVYHILHETAHALGIGHAGDNGRGGDAGRDNPLYTRDDTIMSDNPGVIENVGLGYLDVAALQFLYGTPKLQSNTAKTLRPTELPQKRYHYSELPPTLDLRSGYHNRGDLIIDDVAIHGSLQFEGSTVAKPVKMRLVGDTHIKDVLADDTVSIALTVTGNVLPNRLQGGKKNDVLIARGNDTSTGNQGADGFVLDANSGFNNVITDFNPREDVMLLKAPIAKVHLASRDNKGTDIYCSDTEGKPLASVFVTGVTAQEIKDHLELPARTNKLFVTVLQDTELSAVHPSGLPAALITNSARRGK